jgi:hypothetical protein
MIGRRCPARMIISCSEIIQNLIPCDGPNCNADDGLFVGSKHVTSGEKVKQLAIMKKVRE